MIWFTNQTTLPHFQNQLTKPQKAMPPKRRNVFDEPPNEKVDEPAVDESENEMTLRLNIRMDARAMMRFPIKKWRPMLIKLVSNGTKSENI